MRRYKNLSGKSGVTEYQAGEGFLVVKFQKGKIYLYDRVDPGEEALAELQRRARRGLGLATFISQSVRKNFRVSW